MPETTFQHAFAIGDAVMLNMRETKQRNGWVNGETVYIQTVSFRTAREGSYTFYTVGMEPVSTSVIKVRDIDVEAAT
jgi:hypothetical protein